MRRRVLGMGSACLVALAVTVGLAVPAATTSCTTHQCDSDFINIDQSTGMTIGGVTSLEANGGPGAAIWESSPIDGTWIDFPGQRTYFFGLTPYFTPAAPPTAYVATGATPNQVDASSTYTQASGELAEFGPFVNGGFLVTNAGCAEYFLYIAIPGTYAPPPPPPPPDAGTDAGD